MLIEQAFLNLPEILVGARYPTQGYEGGIVAAFGMAILQELNGRNANNPISHLIAERIYQIDRLPNPKPEQRYLYETHPFRDSGDKPRYLRADMHVSLGDLRTGTHALARYGWRWSNWIEAKFYRDSFNKHSPNKPINGGGLAADLLRLMALPPIEKWAPRIHGGTKGKAIFEDKELKHQKLFTGRYLLHVYQGPPSNYHGLRRNKHNDIPGAKRKWLGALLEPGEQKIETLDLTNETETFLNPINPELKPVDCQCRITNFVLKPLFEENREDAYFCILSRIDSFVLSHGQDQWQVTLNREGIQNLDGAFKRIRYHVGNHIHAKAEDIAPKAEDTNAEVETDEIEDEDLPEEGPSGDEPGDAKD